MYHSSFTGGLSRFDLHTNTDLFLRLSYVFVPCYHDSFLNESLVRLRRNRSIRLCFPFFALVQTLGAQLFWDGTPKALLYN